MRGVESREWHHLCFWDGSGQDVRRRSSTDASCAVRERFADRKRAVASGHHLHVSGVKNVGRERKKTKTRWEMDAPAVCSLVTGWTWGDRVLMKHSHEQTATGSERLSNRRQQEMALSAACVKH